MIERPYDVDLTIIGGGPAGIAAALTASEQGVKCLLVERSGALGGQILSVHPRADERNHDPAIERTYRLCTRLSKMGIRAITKATIWNVEPTHILHIALGPSNISVKTRALLITTGARERPMPFLGWCLPGVITCGAAQRLIGQEAIKRNRPVLVAGRGPLLLGAAVQLVDSGVNVVGLVEATPPLHLAIGGLRLAFTERGRVGKAATWLWRLVKERVPLLFGHAVIEAGGNRELAWVVTAPLDRQSRPIIKKRRKWLVDTLCISNGLEPNIELYQILGCELVYDSRAQAYFPRINDTLQTSIPWVYAAGEVTGIGGVEKALIEGELVGLHASIALGVTQKLKLVDRIKMLSLQRDKSLRQAHAVDSAFIRPAALVNIASPETIACRCEEVTLGELRSEALISNGSPRDIKMRTRIGMGMCQGRICSSTLYHELMLTNGHPVSGAELLRVRPPLEPISLEQLTHEIQSITGNNDNKGA